MNFASDGGGEKESSGSPAPQSRVWVRVLLAGVAVHLASIALTVVLVPAYAILAGGFAGLVSTISMPLLTLPAAAWAARGTGTRSGPVVGLAVGLLVAAMLGLLFFWPYDPRSVALFALIVAAGLAGGLAGARSPTGARRWE